MTNGSATGDSSVRTAAYEVLNTFVTNSANDTLPLVAELSDIILNRLEGTIPMQRQVVSMEDGMILEEIQTSLISVLIVSTWSHGAHQMLMAFRRSRSV